MKQLYSQLLQFLRSGDQRIYYVLLVISLLVPNIVLSLVMQQAMVGRLLNVLVMLPLYMLVLLLAKRPGRIYWSLLVLVLLHAFQLVLLTIFSGSVVAVDMILNLFTSEPDEAGELLSNILLPIIGILGGYLLMLLLASASARGTEVLSVRFRKRCALSALALLLVALPIWIGAKRRAPYLHLRAEVYPMSVFYNMYLATKKLSEVLHYNYSSEGFSYRAESKHPEAQPEVYVLILGETNRAYSWSLYGYPRPTTPRLDSLQSQGALAVYRDVLTQSNTTYKSVPIILSPADAEHTKELPRVEGILSAFREAGFHTAFITNQPGNHSYVDFFAMQGDEYHSLRKDRKHRRPTVKPTGRLYDRDMLPYLDRLLESEHPKLFIVLHSYGAHFSYRDRYPQEEAHFVLGAHYSGSERDSLSLRAAYDNAVRQTDSFITEVITRLERQQRLAALLYVSDHGEDVYDDARGRFLHSSPDVSYYQLHIPLVLWTSASYRSSYPLVWEAALANQRQPASTNAVFHTLLDMAGITTSYRRESLSLTSRAFVPGTRYYLNDRYECVPIEQLELSEEDQQMFRRQGLHYQPHCD